MSELSAFFYEVAERYGKKKPRRVRWLAFMIAGRGLRPLEAPAWLFEDDKTCGMETHERRALCQWSGYVHPYTCNDDKCRAFTRAEPKGDAWPLHPKREGGWVCLHCGLHQ